MAAQFRMEDLQPGPGSVSPTQGAAQKPEKPRKKVVRRRRKKSKAGKVSTAPKKPIPTSSAQPRDHLGRFASIAGRALWGATKATAIGTAKAVIGTVKAGKRVRKGVRAYQKQTKRRQNIELRKRAVAVREREQQLRGKKKIVRRRR